jgi:isopropylmalate/homocitrate/citramalate synthase
MTYVTVDVDIELSDFDTEDLVEELENRGIELNGRDMQNILSEIFELKRNGKDYSRQLDELIYTGIGRFA